MGMGDREDNERMEDLEIQKEAAKHIKAATIGALAGLEAVIDLLLKQPSLLTKLAKVTKLMDDALSDEGFNTNQRIAILSGVISKFKK